MKKLLIILLFFVFLGGCIYENNGIIVSFVTYEGHKLEDVALDSIRELPSITREGHEFEGWFEDSNHTISAELNNITEDITLYAKWSIKEYTIKFVDYDNSVISEQVLNYQEKIIVPDNPVRSGYKFIRWSEEFDLAIADVIIKAIYDAPSYTVSFVNFDGLLLKTDQVEEGEAAEAPSDPTYEGKIFKGWSVPFNNITTDLIVTALYYDWQMSFDTDGGNIISPIYGNDGESYNLPTPKKTNYSFMGWSYNNNLVDENGVYPYTGNVNLVAVWLEKYLSNGTVIKYRNSTEPVMIPSKYTSKEKEFRGMWISHLTGDVSKYISKDQMMRQLTTILDNMEAWNMNALVYHVRINNDALYPSQSNPIRSDVSNANFAEWDYLEWLIDEAHKRGIEFHAWMNPYRISTSSSLNEVLAKYANYPNNPASKKENIIMSGSSSILNPGEPLVRQFLIDTCMEVIQKYNVDAIHFDDYFYIEMDQGADLITYNKYKANSSTTNIEDWRREQVDIFIRDLKLSLDDFNTSNNRDVELGISPSGIYRNGNGVVTYDSKGTAITTGSNTAGWEHYKGYLYSDSKKWIDEEWIDYITPQSYWGFTHPTAGYADVVDWWAKVVKYKDVKLYTGMGIYMGDYSWGTNPKEASDQVLYNSKFKEIQGVCIFRYNYFISKLNTEGVKTILNEYWTNKVEVPD